MHDFVCQKPSYNFMDFRIADTVKLVEKLVNEVLGNDLVGNGLIRRWEGFLSLGQNRSAVNCLSHFVGPQIVSCFCLYDVYFRLRLGLHNRNFSFRLANCDNPFWTHNMFEDILWQLHEAANGVGEFFRGLRVYHGFGGLGYDDSLRVLWFC